MSRILDFLLEVLPEQPPMQIVDVGANATEVPSYAALANNGLALVTGFEPHPNALDELEENTPEYARFLENAVGLPGKANFNAYPSSEMSSIYKICPKATGYLGQFRRHIGTETELPIEVHALDDLNEVPQIDLLKIDAQGAECDVIDGGHDKLLGAVAVIAEARFYRIYRGEPMLGQLDMTLREQGFELHKFMSQKRRMLPHSQHHNVARSLMASQLIDGDAVYVRNMEDKSTWGDTQLCYLTLLAGCVFESHDMALMCLDELVKRNIVADYTPAEYVENLPVLFHGQGKK